MPIGSLYAPTEGSTLKVYNEAVAGSSSYTSPYTISTPFKAIVGGVVSLENNPGNKLITYSFSGNSVLVKFYTISSDTTSGAISATEDAAGTDESSLTLSMVIIGY